jgi:crotonobetainyl-CoA:carnitine CoA-transferase CaiB-like acyl-CoA transferase
MHAGLTRGGKPILISIHSEREWATFCAVFLRDAGAARDARFASNVARTKHLPKTDAPVARAFAGLDEAAAVARLTKAGIAFASVNDMAPLAGHPHLRRISVETPAGPVAVPAPIVRGGNRQYGPVPALGAPDGPAS